MTDLVLGSSGFIGKHLVEKLLSQGQSVTAFDRVKSQSDARERLSSVGGDFSKDYPFRELVAGHDRVFHLISTTVPSSKIALSQDISENVFATLALLDACVAEMVREVIFVSSGGTVYGESQSIGIPFNENSPTNPITSYGIQKLMIEKYLELYRHRHGLEYKVIRLANPYGIGQNPKGEVGAITVFLHKLLRDEALTIFGNGDNVRDYIAIDDAIQGIVNIASLDSQERVFNLGSGQGTSLKAIISYLERYLSKTAQVHIKENRGTDLSYSVLDISRYQTYFPNHVIKPVEEGIADYITTLKELERNDR